MQKEEGSPLLVLPPAAGTRTTMEEFGIPPTRPVSLTEAVDQIVAEEHAAANAAAADTDVPFLTSEPRLVEPVEIKLDRLRHMTLPFWALNRFQTATGVSPWDHEKVWGYPPDINLVVHLIWAALLDEDPEITPGRVERLPGMEFANMLYIRGRLDLLWGRNNPELEASVTGAGAEDPNALPADSTG